MPGGVAEALSGPWPWAALAVVLPLAALLVAALSARWGRSLAWPVAAGGLWIAMAAALQVARQGPVPLAAGGWGAPLGIMLRLDGLAAAILLAGALVTMAALALARGTFDAAAPRQSAAFWPLAYGLIAALNAAFVSADLFNVFVALELLTVCGVGLVALEGSAVAIASALRYLMFALLGSLAYLTGVVLLYLGQGTLDFALLAERLTAGGAHTAAAAALLTVGLMAKAALFPLHGWLASAHASAPPAASALLSALVVKAPFLVLLRLWWEVLGPLATPLFAQGMGALGAAAILIGSFQAMRQRRLKLVIAYSTVAQLGYLLLVFPLAFGVADTGGRRGDTAVAAWSGVTFHALSHALAKGAMFLSAGVMVRALGHDRVAGMAGLGRALPIAAFAFAIAAVSLMGLPPSGGFIGKYLLLSAALGSGQWWWAAVMLAGGLLAAAYLFRPLARLMMDRPVRLQAAAPRRTQAVALLLALASVALGLLPAEPYRLLAIGLTGRAGAAP